MRNQFGPITRLTGPTAYQYGVLQDEIELGNLDHRIFKQPVHSIRALVLGI